MKKAVIAIIGLSISGLVSASTCEELFSDANSSNSLAQKYAKQANDSFTEMKDLAGADAPDKEICDIGKLSRMNGFQSARGFRMARASWLEAIDVCDYPNDKSASEQADINTTAYNTQANFVADMDNLLGSRCGAKPLSPLLESIDN